MQIQISKKHKMLGVPASTDVENLWPGAQRMNFGGATVLLLPHDPTTTFLLRKLGHQVPAPILTHYEWPGVAVPFEAQRKTSALLTMNERAYVLNGKGTGKTKSALYAFDFLKQHSLGNKMLVVAPLSTLRFTWQHEIISTLPHRRCVVLHGSKQKRQERLMEADWDIAIINHDGIKVLYQELAARSDIDVLCIDELAVFRNGGADRTKVARKLAAKMRWVWGLTGDPMPNEVTDVWSQCTIITPHTVPKYFNRYRDMTMFKVNDVPPIFKPKPEAIDYGFSVMQPSVRFSLDDVQELPELVERWVDVEIGAKQERVYKDMRDKCIAAVDAKQITAMNAGAAMNKLLQVSLGWVYTADGQTVGLDNDKRLDALVDDIRSAARKVLVFVPYKHVLAGITEVLANAGIEHCVVSGDTPADERAELFNAFQNTSKYKVLAAHPACLAHGITLTAADTIIWFGPITSHDIYSQANARIRRVGQQHKQLVLHYQGTPVEKRVYAMLRQKQNVQAKFLELFEEDTSTQEH